MSELFGIDSPWPRGGAAKETHMTKRSLNQSGQHAGFRQEKERVQTQTFVSRHLLSVCPPKPRENKLLGRTSCRDIPSKGQKKAH